MKIDLTIQMCVAGKSSRMKYHCIGATKQAYFLFDVAENSLPAGKSESIGCKEDLQVSLVKALLPEDCSPGRSNSQRGGRHGPGKSACRAEVAGTQSGRAHATPASLQAAAADVAADGRPDEFYQATTGEGHRVIRSSISSSSFTYTFPRHSRDRDPSVTSPRCAAIRPRSTSLHRVPVTCRRDSCSYAT